MSEEAQLPVDLGVVRQNAGVPFVRLFGMARSMLASATRSLSRRCFSLVLLLGIPTTVLGFFLRTLSSMQATKRRKALADVAERRRQEARANIAAEAATAIESARSLDPKQDVCSLSFLDLQKRLKDGKLTAKAVLACYQAQASHAHSRVNCLTEFLPEANQVAEARIMPSTRARRCFVPQASLFAL
jgi:hypothetical protein